MSIWTDFSAPSSEELGDHDVPRKGYELQNKRIALLVTGSIASYTVPSLARELRKYGADVQAFVSESALKYGANICALEWATYPNPVITELTSASEHLSLGNPFDLYLVAPATANTICKTASGISDTVVTGAMASALGRRIPVAMAPSMHGSLHTGILTEAMKKLTNEYNVFFIEPFDAFGKHNMADKKTIVMDVCRIVSGSPLRDKKVLVTAGPTPTPIDDVRMITNRFSGKQGIIIAEKLYRKGADVQLLQAYSGIHPPRYIPHTLFKTYQEYLYQVIRLLGYSQSFDDINDIIQGEPPFFTNDFDWGIFSAAVADYEPEQSLSGKTPSGGELNNIKLTPTHKVIDIVRKAYPDLNMATFKFEIGKDSTELAELAQQRLADGHQIVVTNDDTDRNSDNEQIARVHSNVCVNPAIGKEEIADELIRTMELKS